jgi:hypothetical protein
MHAEIRMMAMKKRNRMLPPPRSAQDEVRRNNVDTAEM